MQDLSQFYEQVMKFKMTCDQCALLIKNQDNVLKELREKSKTSSGQNMEEAQSLMNEFTKLDGIHKTAKMAHNHVLALKQSQAASQNDSISMPNLIKTIRAIRTVYLRKQGIEDSLQKLNEKKIDLGEKLDDSQSRLQAARMWANEAEAAQELESQTLVKVERGESRKVKEAEKAYADALLKSKDATRENFDKQRDAELFVTRYDQLIPLIEAQIANTKPRANENVVKQYANYVDEEIKNINFRLAQYTNFLTMSYNMDQLQVQVSYLYNDLKNISDSYLRRSLELQSLIIAITDKKGAVKNLSTQNKNDKNQIEHLQKELDSIKVEVKNNSENTDVLTKKIAELTTQKENIRASVEKEVWDKYFQYLAMHEENETTKMLILEEQNNINELAAAQRTASQIAAEYMSNSSNPAVIKIATEQFTKFINEHGPKIKEMILRAEKTMHTTSNTDSLALDDVILRLQRPPKARAQVSSELDFENPELAKYVVENCSYKVEGKKVFLEWATVNVFINILFHPENKEHDFIRLNLFAWHNSTIDASKVIDLLSIIHYNVQSKVDFLNLSIDMTTFANQTCTYLQKWLEMFPEDFINNKDLLDKSIKLLQDIQNVVDITSLQQSITNPKLSSQYHLNKRTETFEPNLPLPKPNEPAPALCIMYDPRVVAAHLMHSDLRVFSNITYKEFLKCNWSNKQEAKTLSPNICMLTERFNLLSQYIQYTIVVERNLSKRAKILAGWIQVLRECRNINYFHGLFAIDGALSAPPILRLEQTWNEIDKLKTGEKYSIIYSEYSRICSPLKKFKNYKAELAKCTKDTITTTLPYIGPWLTDMTFIKDGNPKSKKVDCDELFNITMHRAYWSAASYLKQQWGMNRSFDIDSAILSQVDELKVTPPEGSDKIDETFLLKESTKDEKDKKR